jgi:hypothetical protein
MLLTAADDGPSLWLGATATLVSLVILAYFLWRLWTLLYPVVPLARGDYAEARRGFERTTRFWMKGAARVSRYNVALCLHYEGRLAEAEAEIRRLLNEPIDTRLAYASRSLLGTILVLREHSLDEARLLLEEAQKQIPTPLGALVLAHTRLASGDRGGAAQLVASSLIMASAPRYRLGWKATLRFDPRVQGSMEAFFRGWYFYKVGEMQRARADLLVAAQSPLPHVCTQRARLLLPTASRPSFDEVPGSLSPHEL